MIKYELGLICFYIAGFGYSDYIVEHFKLEGLSYLIYYTIILLIGSLIYFL